MKPKRQFDETIAFWPRVAYNEGHGFDAVTNRRNAGCIAEKKCKSRGFAPAAKWMRKDLHDKMEGKPDEEEFAGSDAGHCAGFSDRVRLEGERAGSDGDAGCDRSADRRTDGSADGRTDRSADGCADRSADGCADRSADR